MTQHYLSGAAILVEELNRLGVEYLFSHTGGSVIPLHAEINRRMRERSKTPRVIMFRHEQGAGHAAEGYAKASGKPGVCLATSGPGATNLVTPIADAFKDSVPTVFLTGQVSASSLGTNAFQEVPICDITRSITKANYQARSAADIGEIIQSAFDAATEGRGGPVLVDICKNALVESAPYAPPRKATLPQHIQLDRERSDEILEALRMAERPVLYGGGGLISSNANGHLVAFAEKHRIPVTLTLNGAGAMPHDHELYLGMPGMHGTRAANYSLRDADLILAIGTRFDDRVVASGFGRKAKVCHVDIDGRENTRHRDCTLKTDATPFLAYALSTDPPPLQRESWHAQIKRWMQQPAAREDRGIIHPQTIIEEISKATRGEAIVTTGVGQHQMWTAHHYNFQLPRSLISSGGLGTMGYGMPAAIGAYLAHPDRTIVCIEGDGSFQMNIQELATISANQIPAKIFVLNNGYLGMVRQWEDMFFDDNHYETCLARTADCDPGCTQEGPQCRTANPDIVELSSVYPGIKTMRIAQPHQIEQCLEQVFGDAKPWLVDVWIDRTENVYPIIPPGKGIDDCLFE